MLRPKQPYLEMSAYYLVQIGTSRFHAHRPGFVLGHLYIILVIFFFNQYSNQMLSIPQHTAPPLAVFVVPA